MEKEDYASFSLLWKTSLNTSIQNLHNRLIRSLALTHEVDVISTRPFSKKFCNAKKLEAFEKQEGRITWHYLEIKRNKFVRNKSTKRQTNKILANLNLKDCIILTDTLNPYILARSTKVAKKYHLPIIGICNNTPSGIHDTDRSYTTSLLEAAKDLSGYITLTSGLNELYNVGSRAYLTFEGIAENKFKAVDTEEYGNYIYYDGRLDSKSGIYELIKAFKLLNNPDINLVFSGYHGDYSRLNKIISNNPNIYNLGMIPADEVLSLESHSLVNINARPYSEDYDRYLIPGNIIDYLASQSITVSVKNNRLNKAFEESVIWIESNDPQDIIDGLNKALALSNDERQTLIKKSNAEANKLYAMSVINRKVILFLKQFLRQKD